MQIKKLILIISIFYSCLIQAAPKILDLELGRSTLADVKKKYKILREYPLFDGIFYVLDASNVSMDIDSEASVWCDPDEVIQAVNLFMPADKFDNLKKDLSSGYKLSNFAPQNNLSSAENKYASFDAGNFRIYLHANKDDPMMSIRYLTHRYMERLLNVKIIDNSE